MSNLPIRSTKLKETILVWLKEQMSHNEEGYPGVGIASSYSENINIPVILVSIGRSNTITDGNNGLVGYDFWERKRTFQSTKDIDVFADAISENGEESRTIAEILVDKMQTEIHRPSQEKIRILKIFDDARIEPTVIRRFGSEGLHVTRVIFTVRVAVVIEKIKEEQTNV